MNCYYSASSPRPVFCRFVQPVRFCYLSLKQWVVQFDNEKCYLSNYVLLMCTLAQPYTYPYSNALYISLLIIPCIIYYVTNKETLTLPLTYSNYMLYSQLWIDGIQLLETNDTFFFYLLDCVLLTSTPTPTLNLPLQ